jgi:hypothetical protein
MIILGLALFDNNNRLITLSGGYNIICLLTAMGLSPGGSTHLHTNNTQNNTNNNRITQITNNVEECGPCPVFANFYPGICHTTEEKARKNHSQGKRNFSQVNKNLSQCTVYVHITKTPTHYKTDTNTHTHTHTHTHTTHTHTHTHTHHTHTHTHTHYKTI